MITLSTRSVAVFVASLVMGTSLPFAASQSLKALSLGDTIMGIGGSTTILHPAMTTKDRVDYGRAIDIYNLYLQEGKTGLVKPNINDRATIDFYLNNPGTERPRLQEIDARTEPLSTTDYVKPEPDVSPVDALSVQERAALLRSEKTGMCWNYPGFSKDYYILCQKFILGKTPKRTTGFQNDLINTRSNGRAILKANSNTSVKATLPLTVKGYDYNSSSSRSSRMLRGSASSK